MKTVSLWYKEFCLGGLKNAPDGYLWTPNKQNINLAAQTYPNAMEYFELRILPTLYPDIPAYYKEFISATTRADLVERANITEEDDVFERLYKLSTLKQFNDEFIIKAD